MRTCGAPGTRTSTPQTSRSFEPGLCKSRSSKRYLIRHASSSSQKAESRDDQNKQTACLRGTSALAAKFLTRLQLTERGEYT